MILTSSGKELYENFVERAGIESIALNYIPICFDLFGYLVLLGQI